MDEEVNAPEDVKGMPEMTVEEWRAEALRRFGSFAQVEFVCPRCRNVAAVEDFEPYKDVGATPESAARNCIGRFDDSRGCDWAAYGLLGTLNGGVRVWVKKDEHMDVFDFAEPSLWRQVRALARPTQAYHMDETDEQVFATAKEVEGDMMYLGMDDTIFYLAEKVQLMEQSERHARQIAGMLRAAINEALDTPANMLTPLVEAAQSPDYQLQPRGRPLGEGEEDAQHAGAVDPSPSPEGEIKGLGDA